MRTRSIALAAMVMAGTFAGGAALAAKTVGGSGDTCFASESWAGWKAPSPNVIYIRVRIRDIYRLDLSAGSSLLQDPDVHLVNRMWGGGDYICTPLDFDLEAVEDFGGVREPLIVKAITKLTPPEIAAIPPKYRP